MPPLADYIWMNGEMTPWADAKVHVMSHALHYGTSVFEGIRVYDTPDGPRGFRLTDHVRRLFDSARIYHFALPFTEDEVLGHALAGEVLAEVFAGFKRRADEIGEINDTELTAIIAAAADRQERPAYAAAG